MKAVAPFQELTLFKNTLCAAGTDFTSNDQDSSNQSVIAVLDILKDIKEMCEIDGKCLKSVEENLHNLIYNKLLLDFDDIEEEIKLNVHICESLPKMSWCFYVKTLLAADWLEMAQKIWAEESVVVQFITFGNILRIINLISNPIMTNLFYKIFTKFISIIMDINNYSKYNIVDDLFENSISSFIRKMTVNQETLELLINALTYFCNKLRNKSNVLKESSTVKLLSLLIILNKEKLEILTTYEDECKATLMNCASAIKEFISTSDCCAVDLQAFLNFINRKINFNFYVYNEKALMMDINIVDSKGEFFEGSLTRILDYFKAQPAENCVDCFKRNISFLQPFHIIQLIETRSSNNDLVRRAAVDEVIELAFKSWPMDIQDQFLELFHSTFSSLTLPSLWTDIETEITKQINLLASTTETAKLNEITSSLAFFCLYDPSQVLTRLISFGFESGQHQLTAKILRHLRHFYQCRTANSNIGAVILHRFIENKLSSVHFANLLTLIDEIVNNRIMQPVELFKKLFWNLKLDNLCHKILFVLQHVIKSDSNEETVFEEIRPCVILLKLGRIIHYCTTVNFDNYIENILQSRQNALNLIHQIIERIKAEYITDHEICWLYSKINCLHSTVHHYFRSVINLHSSRKLQLPEKSLHLSDLLMIECYTERESFVTEESEPTFTYDEFCCAVAKILPRLSERELVKLPNKLENLLRHIIRAPSLKATIAIEIIIEATFLLLVSHSTSRNVLYLQLAIANCTLIIKAILKYFDPMEKFVWLSTIRLVTSFIQRLGNLSKLGELLLVDLITSKTKDIDSVTTEFVINTVTQLNNPELINELTKLFEEKSERKSVFRSQT